jgi:hypothetical protein
MPERPALAGAHGPNVGEQHPLTIKPSLLENLWSFPVSPSMDNRRLKVGEPRGQRPMLPESF